MIKALAFDLDGTLLNSEKKLPVGAKKVLRELYQKGMEILIVTGRPYSSTLPTLEDLDLPITAICYNGGKIVDTSIEDNKDKVLVNKILPKDVAKDLIDFVKRKDIEINLFQDDICYVRSLDSYSTKIYVKNSGLIPILVDINKISPDNITKGVIIDNDENFLNDLKGQLKDLMGDRAYITFTQAQYLEVLNKDINKGKALTEVLASKGIKMEECMAFGDSENDLEMIQGVGHGVAMKNAIDDVKKLSKYVTEKTNDEDGIEIFLKKYFEEKLN